MSFVIEKNVAIPSKFTKQDPKYPFRAMEVGDSFMVPLSGDSKERVLARMSSAAGSAKRILKREFSVRSVDNGVRVWRMA